jgi:hypothetical protein
MMGELRLDATVEAERRPASQRQSIVEVALRGV